MVFFCIPCLVLLAYFAVMGIFSPKYRVYIKDGWRCFSDKLRRRKCSVSFDNKMRIALSVWLTRHGMVRAGRFFHNERNFNWSLIIFGVVTTVVSAYLFVLLVQFLLVESPCAVGGSCAVNV